MSAAHSLLLGQNCERYSFTLPRRRYLLENMDWFEEELGEYGDDYLIIDCPGTNIMFQPLQPMPFAEFMLFAALRTNRTVYALSFLPDPRVESQQTGIPNMCYLSLGVAIHRRQIQILQVRVIFPASFNFRRAADAIVPLVSSGVLSAMSAMVNLEIPWINIMSKMDLVSGKSEDPARGRNGIRRKRNVARYLGKAHSHSINFGRQLSVVRAQIFRTGSTFINFGGGRAI